MKTIFTCFLAIFFVFVNTIHGQIASANFNDGKFPQGWSTVINTGPCDWDTFTNDPPRGLNFRSTALIFNDDTCGDNNSPSNVSLLTPVYNVANRSPLLLTVEIGLYGNDGEGESLKIEVYNGSSWVTLKTFVKNWNPYVYQVDVSQYANAEFRVRFTYDDNGEWSYYAGIDNFSLTQEEFPDTPAQTNCASAKDITPGTHTVKPIQRGNAPNVCDPSSTAQGAAWFSYTATRDGIATVSSVLSQNEHIDTNLNILTGTCGDLQCYAQNDNVGGLLFSEISFEIERGTSYYIVFDDQYNNQGFDFSLTEEEETCSPGDRISVDFTDVKGFQACHTTLDADGDSNSWYVDAADFKMDGNITYFALNSANQDSDKEDYLFSPKLTLTAGKTYNIAFTYNGGDTPFGDANENLQVLMADDPDTSATMTLLYEDTNIVQNESLENSYEDAIRITGQEFTPMTSGDYYLTFKTTSANPSGFLFLFDYSFEPNTLSIEDIQTATVNHFYNTTTHNLGLRSTSLLKSITLYTLQGLLLRSEKLQGTTAQINLNTIADGIYIAQVRTLQGNSSFKVLKR